MLHGLLLNMAIFETVADLGSFSAAAEALQMTPSSVSKRVAQLEERLGAKLIERTTRSMRLTNTGNSFLTYCKNMLNEAHNAVEVVHQSIEVLAGDVSIGVPKSYASHVIGGLFIDFLNQYPDIHLKTVVTDDSFDLLRDNVDCAIEIKESPPDYLIAKPLRDVRQILCATPQYLASHPHPIKTPSDLTHHQCIYLGETSDDNKWRFVNLSEPMADIMIEVSGRYAVNHTGMRLEGVLNHLGVGCFPDFAATKALDSGAVVEVLPHWQLKSKYEGTAWLTYLPNKFRPLRLQALIDFLQGQ